MNCCSLEYDSGSWIISAQPYTTGAGGAKNKPKIDQYMVCQPVRMWYVCDFDGVYLDGMWSARFTYSPHIGQFELTYNLYTNQRKPTYRSDTDLFASVIYQILVLFWFACGLYSVVLA